jgi:excisionase family DNA binding protein
MSPDDSWLAVMSSDLDARLRRVLTVTRAQAAGGRYPLLLEDANVLTARLLETNGCVPATEPAEGSNLDSGELLSVTEAARLVGCSPTWVRRIVGSGRLAAVKVAGVWMIRRTDLELYRHRKD